MLFQQPVKEHEEPDSVDSGSFQKGANQPPLGRHCEWGVLIMPICWHEEDPVLLREAIRFTAAETGFSERLIEKDCFCSVSWMLN